MVAGGYQVPAQSGLEKFLRKQELVLPAQLAQSPSTENGDGERVGRDVDSRQRNSDLVRAPAA